MTDTKEIINYELPQVAQLKDIDLMDLSKVNWDELLQYGIDTSELKGYTQWLLGKLANRVTNPPADKLEEEGEETAGEIRPKHGALKSYALGIKQNYTSLMQYGSIYRKFTAEDPQFHPSQYHGTISWGVLALVASKSDKPITLLKALIDEDKANSIEQAAFGIKELQAKAEENKGAEEGKVEVIPEKPVITLHWSRSRKLFQLEINPNDFTKIDFSKIKDDLRVYLQTLD